MIEGTMAMRRYRVPGFIVLAFTAAVSAVSAQSPAQPPAPAAQGNVAAGQRAYTEYACYYCHGTVGQGSLPTVGPRIARVARSLDNFRSYVRRPTGRMSSYPDRVISDAALADIYAYLRSLPEPSKPLPGPLDQLRKR